MDPPQQKSICEEEPPSDDEELISKIDRDKEKRIAFLRDVEKVNGDLESFKPVDEYVPATEIDAYLGTYDFGEEYVLKTVDVDKADFSRIIQSFRHVEYTHDPRLKILLGLNNNGLTSKPEIQMQNRFPGDSKEILLLDPFNVQEAAPEKQISKILYNSWHYNQLSPAEKEAVHKIIDELLEELKIFHEDTSPNKVFDYAFVAKRPQLQQILLGLNVFVNADGEFEEIVQMMPIIEQPPPVAYVSLPTPHELAPVSPFLSFDPKNEAYVNLSPAMEQERVNFMDQDAGDQWWTSSSRTSKVTRSD